MSDLKHLDKLLPIGERLRADLKSNDHYTAEPMFCLQILQRDAGYDAGYADNKCWWNPEMLESVYDDDSDERKADLRFIMRKDECGFEEAPAGWEGPFGYKDRWETVMIALTQKGIDDYMDLDGHNVKRRAFRGMTRTYVESFRRCQEMIDIREALIRMATDREKRGVE